MDFRFVRPRPGCRVWSDFRKRNRSTLDNGLRVVIVRDPLAPDRVRAAFAKWIRPDDFAQVVRGPAAQ
ncbi:MAG: hypothetical protein ACRD30_08775 [Bryobacteraceae bacterium]